MWSVEKKMAVGECLWCSEVFCDLIVIESNDRNSCYLSETA